MKKQCISLFFSLSFSDAHILIKRIHFNEQERLKIHRQLLATLDIVHGHCDQYERFDTERGQGSALTIIF